MRRDALIPTAFPHEGADSDRLETASRGTDLRLRGCFLLAKRPLTRPSATLSRGERVIVVNPLPPGEGARRAGEGRRFRIGNAAVAIARLFPPGETTPHPAFGHPLPRGEGHRSQPSPPGRGCPQGG